MPSGRALARYSQPARDLRRPDSLTKEAASFEPPLLQDLAVPASIPPHTSPLGTCAATWAHGGLWLRDLGAVDDPEPRAIGLAAQHLHPDARFVRRVG